MFFLKEVLEMNVIKRDKMFFKKKLEKIFIYVKI